MMDNDFFTDDRKKIKKDYFYFLLKLPIKLIKCFIYAFANSIKVFLITFYNNIKMLSAPYLKVNEKRFLFYLMYLFIYLLIINYFFYEC